MGPPSHWLQAFVIIANETEREPYFAGTFFALWAFPVPHVPIITQDDSNCKSIFVPPGIHRPTKVNKVALLYLSLLFSSLRIMNFSMLVYSLYVLYDAIFFVICNSLIIVLHFIRPSEKPLSICFTADRFYRHATEILNFSYNHFSRELLSRYSNCMKHQRPLPTEAAHSL